MTMETDMKCDINVSEVGELDLEALFEGEYGIYIIVERAGNEVALVLKENGDVRQFDTRESAEDFADEHLAFDWRIVGF